MFKRTLSLLTSVAIVALSSGAAEAFSLIGSELRLRTEAQSTPTSQLFVTSFPASAMVSESAVEFPNVASLFDPNVGAPPGFARSLVNVAIDAGSNYLEIDFDNAGSGIYATGFKNTYVFTFTAPLALQITDIAIDPRTTLGLTADRVAFSGNELFVNVSGLLFNRNSLARLNLNGVTLPDSDDGILPSPDNAAAVPEPTTMLGIALAGSGFAYFKRRRSV